MIRRQDDFEFAGEVLRARESILRQHQERAQREIHDAQVELDAIKLALVALDRLPPA